MLTAAIRDLLIDAFQRPEEAVVDPDAAWKVEGAFASKSRT